MRSAEPIRDAKKIKAISQYYLERGQTRNYLLFLMGIHTALRISDMLRLRWKDVYDFQTGQILAEITLKEQKTGKTKTIALHKAVRRALEMLLKTLGTTDSQAFLFASKRQQGRAISRIQAYRIIRDGALSVALGGVISCHSLRKTFGYHAWKKNIPLAIIMEIYNHSSIAVTRRYLGVTQDDKNSAYLGLDLIS